MNNQSLPTCHRCGFGIKKGFRLISPSGAQHVFCDSDCLRCWLQEQHELFLAQLKRENEEMVQ